MARDQQTLVCYMSRVFLSSLISLLIRAAFSGCFASPNGQHIPTTSAKDALEWAKRSTLGNRNSKCESSKCSRRHVAIAARKSSSGYWPHRSTNAQIGSGSSSMKPAIAMIACHRDPPVHRGPQRRGGWPPPYGLPRGRSLMPAYRANAVIMIVVEHLDDDAVESLISGMGLGLRKIGEYLLGRLSGDSHIQCIGTHIDLVIPTNFARTPNRHVLKCLGIVPGGRRPCQHATTGRRRLPHHRHIAGEVCSREVLELRLALALEVLLDRRPLSTIH